MLLVLALGAALWGGCVAVGVPRRARWPMLGLLYIAVLFLHVVLPDGHPLRAATGDTPAPWLLLGGFSAIVLVYRAGLRRLRTRAAAQAPETPTRPDTMSEVELERYSRHIMLREIGGPGQARLRKARVLVIGAGGLGSPALLYLAAAGVGTIGVIDDDVVENSNLQRQVIHYDDDIGMPKTQSASFLLSELNPFVRVLPYQRRLTPENAKDLFAQFDVILDGTDSLDVRYLANRAAIALELPLVSGALSQWEGQLSIFDPARGAPCYRCVFPEAPAAGLAPSCAEAGVLGPLPGVIGAMMAAETVKLITGAGAPMLGRMLIYDALYGETRTIGLKRRTDCPDCGGVGAV